MPRRNRYIGWMVCRSDLHGLADRTFARAGSEAEARAMVQRLNTQADAGVLFWCEWWSTNSSMALSAASAQSTQKAK